MSDSFDIAVVGGGMVGASLAVALEGLGLSTALIEAVAHDAASQPSFDERTTALSNGSRRILETLGVWETIAQAASPIRKIHVSDRGRFGLARIDAREQGLDALGYVITNRVLGAALYARLQGRGDVRTYCPARVTKVEVEQDAVTLGVTASGGGESQVRARLVVAADGADSAVRSAFGVAADVRDYRQSALITTVLPRKFHEQTAYERFTEEGPLALLPLTDGRCGLVLTLGRERAEAALHWTDEEFLAETQRRFGFRLGRFLKVGRRTAYPLALTRARRTSAERCVIIGNAAQGLHPISGMGFNLGLRDAATLAELAAERPGTLGAPEFLAAYDAWRAADRDEIIAFTDGLVRLFSNPLSAVRGLRNLGLLAFDQLPPAKSALAALSTGTASRIPKLARGVALAPQGVVPRPVVPRGGVP